MKRTQLFEVRKDQFIKLGWVNENKRRECKVTGHRRNRPIVTEDFMTLDKVVWIEVTVTGIVTCLSHF